MISLSFIYYYKRALEHFHDSYSMLVGRQIGLLHVMTGARTYHYNIKRRNNNNKGYKQRICQHYKRVVQCIKEITTASRNVTGLHAYIFPSRIVLLEILIFYCFARSANAHILLSLYNIIIV